MKRIVLLLIFVFFPGQCPAAQKILEELSCTPYCAAMALDADTGEVYLEEHTDTVVYPASVLKMMTLLITLEAVEAGQISLTDMVQVTKEAAEMGGSQVYLDPQEQFSVEELLYALTVQSANDAATALALHVAGSKAAFVALMNGKAKELGMRNSHFHSVHGLPPAAGQEADTTTAQDLALLSLALVGKPQTFLFTGTAEREFRDGQFIMYTHNHLLNSLEGCDGLKTGYFQAAGYSIVATALRGGRRMIAIVLGSRDRKTRDERAKELIEQGFARISTRPAPKRMEPAPASDLTKQPETGDRNAVQILETTTLSLDTKGEKIAEPAVPAEEPATSKTNWIMFLYGLCSGLGLSLFFFFLSRRKTRRPYRYTP